MQQILALIEKNLGGHLQVKQTIDRLRSNPEIFDILLAELNAAIHLFNRKKNESMLLNSQKLIGILGHKDLPDCEDLLTQKLPVALFKELNKLEFLDEKSDDYHFAGRLLIAVYRTFILQTYPILRKKGTQVASTIEEMLAILALKGFDTHLFQATKHWIKDWKREGFSKELALRIKNL